MTLNSTTFEYARHFQVDNIFAIFDLSFPSLKNDFNFKFSTDYFPPNIVEKRIQELLELRTRLNNIIKSGRARITDQQNLRKHIQRKLALLYILANQKELAKEAALDILVNFPESKTANWARNFCDKHYFFPCCKSQSTVPRLTCLSLQIIAKDQDLFDEAQNILPTKFLQSWHLNCE